MISLNLAETVDQMKALEAAAQGFDSNVAGPAPPQVEAGIASFVLEDVLAMVAQTALRTVKHVDATAEFARLAVDDLVETEASINEDVSSFGRALG